LGNRIACLWVKIDIVSSEVRRHRLAYANYHSHVNCNGEELLHVIIRENDLES
jgi:hypothetical protein